VVKTSKPEDVEKLTELYIKLEQIQAYIRKIDGRIKKYSTDLESLRKKRLEKEGEMVRGLKPKKAVWSDKTI
jgi:hypothetical protein